MKRTLLSLLTLAALALAAEAPQTPEKPAVPPPRYLKSGLPEIVYAAPGIECNIYFENVVDTAVFRNYAVEVRCSRGAQGEHRWYWMPTAEDAGKSFDLELRLFDDDGMVLSSTCKVVVAAKAAEPQKKFTLALLADSFTTGAIP